MSDKWKILQDDRHQWAQKTFGEKSPSEVINKLREEVEELAEEPYNLEEYADCMLLLMGALGNAGLNMAALHAACTAKLDINKARQWGKKKEDGTHQHET